MTLCLTCRNEDSCVETDLRKIRGECEYYKPTTNADRIRSMTDEELAEFLYHNVSKGTVNCAFCAATEFCHMGHNGWLDWLKQEAEEET